MRPIAIRKHVSTPQGVPMWYVTYQGQLVGMHRNGRAAMTFVHKELSPKRRQLKAKDAGRETVASGRGKQLGEVIGSALMKSLAAQQQGRDLRQREGQPGGGITD